jgi:hypothetical protein
MAAIRRAVRTPATVTFDLADRPPLRHGCRHRASRHPRRRGRPGCTARDHRLFAGRIDRSKLGFAERAIMLAVRAADGDFRDLDAISAWVNEITDALLSGTSRGTAAP